MKDKRRRIFGELEAQASFFSKGERNRMIVLCLLFVLVAIVFVGAIMQRTKYERIAKQEDIEEPRFEEEVVLPRFDSSQIEGQVADSDRESRVLLEPAPFDALVRFVAQHGQTYFRALGARPIDEAVRAELFATPDKHRAEPFRARGFLERLRARTRPDGIQEHRGWLRLEDGTVAHFAVQEIAEGVIVDDFVRVDGLFLKLFAAEGDKGWEEGPLLVGSALARSYARPEALDPEELRLRLALVQDDTVENVTMLDGPAFDAKWLLMIQAAEQDPAAVDWSQAPVLDNAQLADLQREGAPARGKAFRIPISRNMGSYTIDPGENPARLERITEGWLGNTTWTARSGLVKYVMPRAAPELESASFVQGHGFFLKNLAYVPRDGGMNVVPLFVMSSLEPFVPAPDKSVDSVTLFVLGVTIALLVAIPLLVLRDRRKSAQLQRELVRRRQARRRRASEAQA